MSESRSFTVDDFAELANSFRHVKESYRTAKKRYHAQLREIEDRVVKSTLLVLHFGQQLKVERLPANVEQLLVPLFKDKANFNSLFLKLLESPSFVRDFSAIFPSQLTLITFLMKNSPTPLQNIYKQLMSHSSVKYIFRSSTIQAIEMLSSYPHTLNLDLTVETIQGGPQATKIAHAISGMPEHFHRRMSMRMWERTGMSEQVHSQLENSRAVRDMELADNVVASLFSNLSKHLQDFGILLRYVISAVGQQELHRRKQEWIEQIERDMLNDCLMPSYQFNVRMVTQLMRLCLQSSHCKFKDDSLNILFKSWKTLFQTFFQSLVELQLNDQFTEVYEQDRGVCCLSGQSIALFGITLPQQLDSATRYVFNTIDPLSSHKHQKYRGLEKKSLFLRIDHEKDWVQLLRITTNENPLLVKEQCLRVQTMIGDISDELVSLTHNAQNYLRYLQWQQEQLSSLLLGMQQEELNKQTHILWRILIIQTNLRLVIEKEGVFFSSEEAKGCSIDTLDKFVEYFGQSNRVDLMVHNSINLEQLNLRYCEFLGLVKSKIRSRQNYKKLFRKIQSRIESYLYYSWSIGAGSSLRDKQIRRHMERKVVRLKDLKLEAFAKDEDFYLSLSEPSMLQIATATSPQQIIRYFQEMTDRILCAMKLSKLKSVAAGDEQVSIIHFLIVRHKLRNFASLLNFVQVCWNQQKTSGGNEYMLATLQGVLKVLLQSSDEARKEYSDFVEDDEVPALRTTYTN